MRVLHVVPSYVPAWRYGGPIRSVHGLCRALARAGHGVEVFTTDRDGPGRLDVPTDTPIDVDGVTVRYFACEHLRRLFWAPAMRKALHSRIGAFDIVHLHSVYLWPTSAAAAAARARGIPYLLAPRGMLVDELIRRKSAFLKRAWIRLIERRNIRGAAALHFTSRLEEEEARSLGLVFERAVIVPNGIESAELETGAAHSDERPSADARGPVLLYIGRLNWKKGLDRLIEALAQLPECRLILAGNDEERYRPTLEAQASARGVSQRVSFPGAVYGHAKAELLRRADVFVLPSYSENFGNVVIEAMAAGCPVVVTPEVGAAEIVRECGAGLVADGAPETLAAAIRLLVTDPAMRLEMGRNGRRAIASRYTWDAVAAQLAAVYREIIGHQTETARRGIEHAA